MDQLIFASLSHTHYWYEVGMLKVPGGHARGRGHCREELGSGQSGGYAPYSGRAEGSSIVDVPGEC